MKFIIGLLITFISCIFSFIIFGIFFNGLNKSRLKLFVPIQKLVVNTKRKQLLEHLVFGVSVAISIVIKNHYNLNYIQVGILIGLLSSLTSIIFDNGMNMSKIRNL